MSPKTLQYLMGHEDISVTLNVYTHLGLEDAKAKKEYRSYIKVVFANNKANNK